MKVELENIRLGMSAFYEQIHAGIPEKDRKSFRHKKNVTSDFIRCVIEWGGGYIRTVTGSDGRTWEITVKEVKKKADSPKLEAKS